MVDITLPLLVGVFFLALGYLVASRLYLHPLSKIPGPRLAALTSLYEFYHDCIRDGQFSAKIEELHSQYGPIVRIGPEEVHIGDPDFFDQLYNVSGRLDKDPWYYNFVGLQDAIFGTANSDLHRMRRKAMSRFFSTSAIARLESSSSQFVAILCRRLEQIRQENKPVNLSHAFKCLATDSVTGMPQPFHTLDDDNFSEEYNRQGRTLAEVGLWNRHIPIIAPIFMAVPRWFIKLTSSPGSLIVFDYQKNLAEQATAVARSNKRSDDSVLEGIVNCDIPEAEKSPVRVTQEAQVLLFAGTETTALVLEHLTYFVLANPGIKQKLKAELASTISSDHDTTSSDKLKKLPYLSAVIKETLRISNSVSGRLSRVGPRSAQQYGHFMLPAGTVMSMHITSLHMNPEIFSNPHEFLPDRWLDLEKAQQLEKYFAPFGRGARTCIGKELAMMTVYLTVANFFHRFDAELYQTTYKELAMESDYFSPFPYRGSKKLRVILKQ